MAVPTGGPGWFNDIFEAKFVFDSSGYTMVPDALESLSNNKEVQMKCFDGKGAISGKLVIMPPEGRDVTHNGVEIIFKSYSHLIEGTGTDSPGEVVLKKWVLLEAGSVAEPVEVAFDIDLSELELRDTFDGTNMNFRHVVGYRIVRPWYTFSVRGEEPICIRNCPPPFKAPPPPENSVLVVDDFGGVCTFDHGKCSFSADGRLVGTIAFSSMQGGTSVAEVSLLIGRTEMWGEASGADATVRYHILHTSDQAPITCDTTIPVDIGLASKGSESGIGEGPIAPSMFPLTPSDPELSKKDQASVTYWVRLLLAMAPKDANDKKVKSHWSTHPILVTPGSGSGSGV